MPERLTRGAFVRHRYTLNYFPPHCRASQYRRTFIAHSASLLDDLANPVFDGVRQEGFKSSANSFFIGLRCSLFIFCILPFYSFLLWVDSVGLESLD